MKHIVLSIIAASVVAIGIAAGVEMTVSKSALPEIDLATQNEVLAAELTVVSAQQSAMATQEALHKAQTDAQPAMQKALKKCNPDGGTKNDIKLKDLKVVCVVKDTAPAPPAQKPENKK